MGRRAEPSRLDKEASIHLDPTKGQIPQFETASSTIVNTMLFVTALASGCTTTTNIMPRTATTLGGVVATTVGKIKAPRSSLQFLRSSTKPYVGHHSQPGSEP